MSIFTKAIVSVVTTLLALALFIGTVIYGMILLVLTIQPRTY